MKIEELSFCLERFGYERINWRRSRDYLCCVEAKAVSSSLMQKQHTEVLLPMIISHWLSSAFEFFSNFQRHIALHREVRGQGRPSRA